MTNEADAALRVRYQFECKKDALRQTQDSGVKVTFTIHPQDMPGPLYQDLMGQRYLAVLVPLADDDTPRLDAAPASVASEPAGVPETEERQPAPKRKWGDLPYPQRAGMLGADTGFHAFLAEMHAYEWQRLRIANNKPPEVAAIMIRMLCQVASRSQIRPDTPAARALDALNSRYRDWQHAPPVTAYEERA